MPKRHQPGGTPNAQKPMKQLQARIEGKSTMVYAHLDEAHMKWLEGIQGFCRNGMHLDPSKPVVIARALEVYFWMLADKLIDIRDMEENGGIDPGEFLERLAGALYEERTALLGAANRISSSATDAKFQKVDALIEKEKKGDGDGGDDNKDR